jgi:hypothetical protein
MQLMKQRIMTIELTASDLQGVKHVQAVDIQGWESYS